VVTALVAEAASWWITRSAKTAWAWLSHGLFPVYVAAFAWGGLLLRRPALWVQLRPGTGGTSLR
jgi:hypothetical protein